MSNSTTSEIQASIPESSINKGLASIVLVIFIILLLFGIGWVVSSWLRRLRQRRERRDAENQMRQREKRCISPEYVQAEIII
ncbi:hypothetical protein G9A89_010028 [Geosiphon pyriformis]|nr:hypothetical protein G9A89_010028 [Geosiphon pyriformis]